MEEAGHFDFGFDVEATVPLLHEDEESIQCEEEEEEEEEELSNGGFLEQNEDSDQGDVAVESLDYDSIHNVVHDQLLTKQQPRRLYGYTGLTLAKCWITVLIGLVVGFIAFLIESCQEVIITSKRDWTDRLLLERGKLGLVFLNYAATSVSLVLLSSCLVIFWAPAAAGGGVTLVMAYLNGNDIPDFFRHRTLFTKILGTICTVSSGLPIGQEGPMVHIGGAIASELTWMHGPCLTNKLHQGDVVRPPQPTWRENVLNQLRLNAWAFGFYNKDRREFISSGAAAGLAAAFGAPIGGVLFSMEEASSFWSRKVMWRSLLCTTCATMVFSLLNRRQFSFLLPGTISFEDLKKEHRLLYRLMHVYHHSHHPHRRYLNSRPEAVDELETDELLFKDLLQPTMNGSSSTRSLEEGDCKGQYILQASQCSGKELAIDFRPWMNRAPLTVCVETSARRVYIIFRTLGLRHLCVTDAATALTAGNILCLWFLCLPLLPDFPSLVRNHLGKLLTVSLVGMITRKDVAKTHKGQLDYLVDSDTQTDGDNSQSNFGGKCSSFTERKARDVLFSLP